jgi:tRNA nucleotidyltransferase/poly(A) polymerase
MNWFKRAQSLRISFDPTEQKIIDFVRKVAQTMGVDARIAGGFVRDKLLGVSSKDIDITLDGISGIDFARACLRVAATDPAAKGQVSEPIEKIKDDERTRKLGTTYLWMFGLPIDLVSLRKEVYPDPNSRVPDIVPATPAEDAMRRDLSINSLFYNIMTGRIEDLTPGKTGMRDLGYDESGRRTGPIVLRTPRPDARETFLEDPLRVLRVMRFYARYPGSKLAPEIKQAMMDPEVQAKLFKDVWVKTDYKKPVSNEMLGQEFLKTMAGPQSYEAVQLMDELGVLEPLMGVPSTFEPWEMSQQNKWHTLTVKGHTFAVLRNANRLATDYKLDSKSRAFLNIAALFHDIGKRDPRSHVMKGTGGLAFHGVPNKQRGDTLRPGVERGIAHEEGSVQAFRRFAKNLKFTNEDREALESLIGAHMRPHRLHEPAVLNEQGATRDSVLRRFYRKHSDMWQVLMLLGAADAGSKTEQFDESAAAIYRQNYERLQGIHAHPHSQNVVRGAPLVNGDVIKALPEFANFDPRTGFIKILQERVKEWQDDAGYDNPLTYDEAVRRLRAEGPGLLASVGQREQL